MNMFPRNKIRRAHAVLPLRLISQGPTEQKTESFNLRNLTVCLFGGGGGVGRYKIHPPSHSEDTYFQPPYLWRTHSLTLCPAGNGVNEYPPCWHLGKGKEAPTSTPGSCCPAQAWPCYLSTARAGTSSLFIQ